MCSISCFPFFYSTLRQHEDEDFIYTILIEFNINKWKVQISMWKYKRWKHFPSFLVDLFILLFWFVFFSLFFFVFVFFYYSFILLWLSFFLIYLVIFFFIIIFLKCDLILIWDEMYFETDLIIQYNSLFRNVIY